MLSLPVRMWAKLENEARTLFKSFTPIFTMTNFISVPPNKATIPPKTEGITMSDIATFVGIAFPIISGIITATVVITSFKGVISTLKAELTGKFEVVYTKLEMLEKGQCERDSTINDLKTQAACNKGNIQALSQQLNEFGINVHTRNTR